MAELNEQSGCLMAQEALARVGELGLSVSALQRRIERTDSAHMRLTERVNEVHERLNNHEAASQQATRQLRESIDLLRKAVEQTINVPPVVLQTLTSTPTTGIVQSWQGASVRTKAKVTGGIITILMAPEFLGAVGKALWELVKHFVIR